MTNSLVPLAEDIASFVKDRDRVAEDPFVVPRDPCLSAAELVFPTDEPCSFGHGLFVFAEPRREHAKALCFLTEARCCLSAGLLSFTACGRKASEVVRSPARGLCTLAKDLCHGSEILVPRTTGLHQEAEDLVSSAKGLREEA